MRSSAPSPTLMSEDENTSLLSKNPTEKTCTPGKIGSIALCCFGSAVLGGGVGVGLATCVEAGTPSVSLNLAHWALGGIGCSELICALPFTLWKNCVETPEEDDSSPLSEKEQLRIN